MSHVDLAFAVTAQKPIASDHGYALFGAVSRVLPVVHQENGFAIHPIRGRKVGDEEMVLTPWSRLTLRTPADRIAELLPLAGQSLHVGETSLRVGVPQVFALTPATALRSRFVCIKVKDTKAEELTPEIFLAAARKQLGEMGTSEEAILGIPPIPTGPKQGEPQRRAIGIKGASIVGYEVIIEALTAEESLTLQEQGLGGRRHMGCGVFVPFEKTTEELS